MKVTADHQVEPFLTTAVVAAASLATAWLVVRAPSPALPLALAAALAAGVALVRWPMLGLTLLLLLYPSYQWLHTSVLVLVSPSAAAFLGVGKELLLIVVLGLAFVTRGDRLRLLPGTAIAAFAAFVALILLLALAAPVALLPSVLEARYHLEYLFLLPAVAMLADSPERRRLLLGVLVFGFAAVAIAWLSLIGWTGLGQLRYAQATMRLIFSDLSGLADWINILGVYAAMGLCLTTGLLLELRPRRMRMLLLALAVALSWALLSTFSRRAIGASLLGLMTIALLGRHWRALLWLGAGAFAVLVWGSVALLRRMSIEAANATGGVSLRLRHLEYTVERLDPLTTFVGHGVGTTGLVPLEAGVQGAVSLHSYYLVLLFEAGLAGLALYLLLSGSCLAAIAERLHRGRNEPLARGTAAGTAGALVCFLAAGVLGTTNAAVPAAPVMWTLVGLTFALCLPPEEPVHRRGA